MTRFKMIEIPEDLKDKPMVQVGFIFEGSTKPGYVRLYSPDYNMPNKFIEWVSGDPLIDENGKDIR